MKSSSYCDVVPLESIFRKTFRFVAGISLCIFLSLAFTESVFAQEDSVPPDTTVDTVDTSPPQPTPSQPRTTSGSTSKQKKINLYPIEKIPVSDTVKIPVLDFKNTDVRDVLRGLGMQYGLNIYLEPEVKGDISLYLVDVTVKSAIDFIAKRSNHAYSVENGIVKFYKYKEPPPPPPPKPPLVFKVNNGSLDIDIKKVKAREVARLFGDSAGINVIVEGAVDKEISARLVNMRPDKAIKALFESNGLAVTMTDGIYYVGQPNWGEDQGGETVNTSMKRLSITLKKGTISLEVDNASLDQVVRTIAIQSGMNIVIYDRLTGTISAKFNSVPIDDALRFLMQNTQFTFWKERNVYFIGSREMNQQKTTVLLPLKHIMASEEGISKILPPSIMTNAVVKYDKEHNSLIVIGSFDIVAQAQEFIEKVDKPVPQVLIEALVVDFNINKIRDYGFSLFTQGLGTDSSANLYSERFLPSLELKPGRQRTARILNNVLKEIGVNKVVELPKNFRASVHALEAADVVKVHSTPQIATINGNPASITIGETRYYKLRKETVAPADRDAQLVGTDERFEVIKFNTQLEVTPWVMDEGYVMVKIRPEFNIPRTGGDGSTPPNVDTRIIESMVRLQNGQTIVLGGQRQTEDVVNSRGIPVLSNIPILGWLFSSKTISKNETQMMIFLTPHVYYGDDSAVSPEDFFGSEVNDMLDGAFGSNKKEAKKKHSVKPVKRESDVPATTSKSVMEKGNKKVSETDTTNIVPVTANKDTVEQEKKKKFVWPWNRKRK